MISKIAKKTAQTLGVHRAWRFLRRKRARILMYHGLTLDPDRREWCHVRVECFERQMEHLVRCYHVVPLRVLVDNLAAGRLEPYTAAVTFDDGYRSVYSLAWPVLRRLGVPATVFLVSSFLAEDPQDARYLWTDEVRVLLASAPQEKLDLAALGLGIRDLSHHELARQARAEIIQQLKRLPVQRRDEVLAHLRERFADRVRHEEHLLYRPMTWSEARELGADPLVTLGAHTRTHPILSRLREEQQEEEILDGKGDLEQRLGIEITEFAYPDGGRDAFVDSSVQLARRFFRSAVTTIEGLNGPREDVHLLKRIGVGSDLAPRDFEAVITGIYDT